MSKYYGTLRSDKGESTRAGHHYISAAAQTSDGTVQVQIQDGNVWINVQDSSTNCPRWEIFSGSLAELVEAGRTGKRLILEK